MSFPTQLERSVVAKWTGRCGHQRVSHVHQRVMPRASQRLLPCVQEVSNDFNMWGSLWQRNRMHDIDNIALGLAFQCAWLPGILLHAWEQSFIGAVSTEL